ncbi:MAG: DNA mismatch endonuclease Vsr [Alphaproteobacteria bacterium]|nr:DNA mismatch endonuclease Vsr [Alphaproteobacteria bacterium]
MDATRSRIMRAVKSSNTGPERALRRALHARGFRFRLNDASLPGAPDIVLPRWRAVIFVHGCFWHRHDCPRGARTPATNVDYWTRKLSRNAERDRENAKALRALGWRVRIVWECELKPIDGAANAAARWLRRATPTRRGHR